MDKKNILIVEDDAEMNKLYSNMLGEEYNLLIVGDTKEAREKLDEGNVDLIILDISLPGEPGDEFLRKLRLDPKYANIAVVIVSIMRDVLNESDVEKLGTIFISKPFERNVLLSAIEDKLKK